MWLEPIVVVNEPSWVDSAGVVVAIAAAVIAAVSALIIMIQAIETRKSTQAALRAVEIAGAEFERGEELRLDAFKARIDAEMPRITVTAELQRGHAVDADTPELMVVFAREPGAPKESEPQSEFIMPRHQLMELRVRTHVTVTNDGPRRMRAEVGRPRDRRKPSESIDLAPGESKVLRVDRVETVGRWVELARSMRGEGIVAESTDNVIFQLHYRFPGWSGAVENHEIWMGGTVLDRVDDNDSAWRLIDLSDTTSFGATPLNVVVMPFERLYFRNAKGDQVMGWLP